MNRLIKFVTHGFIAAPFALVLYGKNVFWASVRHMIICWPLYYNCFTAQH